MESSNDGAGLFVKTKKRKNFLWSVKPEWITTLLVIMCEFVDANLKSAQGFKDAIYQGAAQKMKEKFGVDVTGEQCKNQIRHQRNIWSHIQELKRKSGVSWDEQRKIILMGHEEYTTHIQCFPKDAAYLNIPIANYVELEKVCGEGHATGDWAKSGNSTTPLGVQQMSLSNDEILSFMETDMEYSHQNPDWSTVDTSETSQQCSEVPEIGISKRESSTSKVGVSRKRNRESDRTLSEYASIVADSVAKVAHAIENQTSARVAQEKSIIHRTYYGAKKNFRIYRRRDRYHI